MHPNLASARGSGSHGEKQKKREWTNKEGKKHETFSSNKRTQWKVGKFFMVRTCNGFDYDSKADVGLFNQESLETKEKKEAK